MASILSHSAREATESIKKSLERAAGGQARLQIVTVLGAVLALDAADKATVSSVADTLEQVFHIGQTEIGLLVACVSLVGAGLTLPMGSLVDRMNRRKLLLASVALWTVAIALSGTASSYIYMLITRIFLGAVTAVAAPAIASLVGDFFPARARAKVYGMVLAGELVGIGAGFLIGGEASSLLDWHWAFYVMVIPSAAIGWAIWRYLPEPARGGQSWIELGQQELRTGPTPGGNGQKAERTSEPDAAQSREGRTEQALRHSGAQPRRELIPDEDPRNWDLWRAIRHVLRIPTYRLLVLASALAYYFLAGIRAFGMIYFTQHYHVSRSIMSLLVVVVGLGALAGVMVGGRFSEWLLGRGVIEARIVVAGGALLLAAAFLAPAIWVTGLGIGLTFLTLGAAALSAANPAIDAARLDIVEPALWGRAEAGRTALRGLLEGGAPLLFGAMASWLGGQPTGLKWTFLIMLVPVLVASSLALPARAVYPGDVATARAAAERHRHHEKGEPHDPSI